MEYQDVFPYVAEEWAVKGTEEKPRLVNWKSGKIVSLQNHKVLSCLLAIDGTKSINDIIGSCNIPLQTESELKKFYDKFAEIGAIIYSPTPCKHPLDVALSSKEPWLREVHMDITSNCNLRCIHCFWGNNLSQFANSDLSNWKKLIFDMKKSGVARTVVSGGEALTNPDFEEIVNTVIDSHIFLAAVFTNGTIWNAAVDNLLNRICQEKLKTSFYISLDGYTSEQHDYIRGNGNFCKTIDFIKKLVDYRETHDGQYKIVVNSLVHQKNYRNLVEWYNYLESMNVDRWRITAGRDIGNFKNNYGILKVSPEEVADQYVQLIYFLIRHSQASEKIMDMNVENLFTTKALKSRKMYLFDKELCICDYKYNGCSVNPQGNVQFCTSWQSITYGNAFQKPLEEIWLSDAMQKMKNMKISEITKCASCDLLQYCGGGCRLECQTLEDKDDNVCETFRVFKDKILPILQSLGIQFLV